MRYLLIAPALALGAQLAPYGAMGVEPGAEPQRVERGNPVNQGRSATSGGCEQNASRFISESTISVQRLIGTPVTNPINEEIGEVSDLLVDQCGRIKAVIIHVGGFMGFGGRYVRVAPDKVRIRSLERSAGMVIMVRETREHILSGRSTVSQEKNGK